MTRMYVDCREMPNDRGCTVALSADSETELVEAACQHAIAVHGETDTPELRRMIRSGIHEGTPPLAPPQQQSTTQPQAQH